MAPGLVDSAIKSRSQTRTADDRPGPRQERIRELDGLRGLAILLVVVCHFVSDVPHGASHTFLQRFATLLGQGQTGVDLFFVLSGFLIGRILLSEKQSPRYYQTFYARRFYRIIPIYYIWLIIFLLITLLAPVIGGEAGKEFRGMTPYWVYFAFLQNFRWAMTAFEGIWLGPTWSLAIEEQFYLISPVLIRNLSKSRITKILFGVVIFAFFARFALAAWLRSGHGDWGVGAPYFWTPARADELALGMLVAVGWTTPELREMLQNNKKTIYTIFWTCTLVLLMLTPLLAKPLSYVRATFGRSIYGIFYAALLLIALVDSGGKIAGLLRWRWLTELGRISYCVYIIHSAVGWLTFQLVLRSEQRFDSIFAILVAILAFGLTVVLAELSWRFIENPLLRLGHGHKY